MAIRIVLLDDQPIVLRGIEQLFESQPDISVIGRTRIPADALKLVETELPDVLVFELPTPRSRAIALLRALRRVPRTHLLLLTGVRELEALVDAVHHGVAGVVTKDMRPEDLVAALHAVASGQTALSPELAQAVHTRPRSAELVMNVRPLTERERQVARLVLEGLRNKMIAQRLSIAESTVKMHLRSVFDKLAIRNRTELVQYVQRHGPI